MVKADIVCADPAWNFSDRLTMSSVKRGAKANYNTMSVDEICDLPVQDICADDALLALWVPGSMISDGLKVLHTWGFEQKQTWIWVKIKNKPLISLVKNIISCVKENKILTKNNYISILDQVNNFNINNILTMKMGRYFRQSHEIALIGARGKIIPKILNKSQRSVHFDIVRKHSEKPEGLQDKLDLMFPEIIEKDGTKRQVNKIELFARRERAGWITIGNECPGSSFAEDIRDSIERIKKL